MDEKNYYSTWFVFIVAIFITSLIAANIIGVKLVEISGFVLPAGTIIFPVSYIFGDVLTEVYGYRQARRAHRGRAPGHWSASAISCMDN